MASGTKNTRILHQCSVCHYTVRNTCTYFLSICWIFRQFLYLFSVRQGVITYPKNISDIRKLFMILRFDTFIRKQTLFRISKLEKQYVCMLEKRNISDFSRQCFKSRILFWIFEKFSGLVLTPRLKEHKIRTFK